MRRQKYACRKRNNSIQRLVNRFVLKKSKKDRKPHLRMYYQTLVSRTISLLRKCQVLIKHKSELIYSQIENFDFETLPTNLQPEEFLKIIGGEMKHQKSFEPYYWEIAYRVHLPDVVQVNSNGVAMNIFKTPEKYEVSESVKTWSCSQACKIPEENIQGCIQFFQNLTKVSEHDMYLLLLNIDDCSEKRSDIQGHPLECYLNPSCQSNLRKIKQLAIHFSALRPLVTHLYSMRRIANFQKHLRKYLYQGNEELLKKSLFDMQQNILSSSDVPSLVEKINEVKVIENHSTLIDDFKKSRQEIPKYACVCCERLNFKHSVHNVKNLRSPKNNEAWLDVLNFAKKCYNQQESQRWFVCNYCSDSLKRNKIPGRAVLNNLSVDPLPPEIESLNMYERFLIQKAKAFQMIVRLGTMSGSIPQNSLIRAVKGRIIYLPLPYEENIDMFNGDLSENRYFVVLVNGHPTKKKVIWQDIVNVEKVKCALSYLKTNNKLYEDVNIGNLTANFAKEGQSCLTTSEKTSLRKISKAEEEKILQHFTVHPLYSPKQNKDDLELYQMAKTTSVPLKTYDEQLDLKCFPELFPTGQYGKVCKDRKIYLSEAEYRKNRILSKHSRFRRNQQYLFHLLHESEIKSLQSAIFHTLRLTKNLTHSNVSNIMSRISSNDREFGINFSTFGSEMRGTKGYWDKRRRELNAMISKFGAPTFFLTLSSAEFSWAEVRSALLESNADIPNVEKLTTGELCALDPVTVSRIFHHRFKNVLNKVILNKENPPLGLVENYFWRIEYQSRAAAHVHMVLWIAGAPVIGVNTDQEIKNFLSTNITCQYPDQVVSPQLRELVEKYQMHKCSKTCMRFKKTKEKMIRYCRFKFPRLCSSEVKINDVFSAVRHHVKSKSSKKLYNLVRQKNERYINDYNPAILLMWEANIDIQYICNNAAALARYVTGYITKSEKCQLRELLESCNENESLRSRLFSIGMKSLTHRECGVYEAADRILGHSLYGKSVCIRYIDVHKKSERSRNLKSYEELCKIREEDPESENIYMNSFTDDYYINRYTILEDISLYRFYENFDYLKSATENLETVFRLNNDLGYIKKRSSPYVINHIKYDPRNENTVSEYYRSMLLLFKPFRNESELLGEFQTFKDAFINEIEINEELSSYHDKLHADLKLDELRERQLNSDSQEVHCSQDENETEEGGLVGDEICPALQEMVDLEQLMKLNIDNDLPSLVANLNDDQRRVYDFAVDRLTRYEESPSTTKPLNLFLSGMGGTGKSYFIKTLVTWCHSHYKCFLKNFEGDPLTVVTSAPTGLAACNIGGVTIHKLFSLPVEHNRIPDYVPLSRDALQTLQYTLQHLKLVIIDGGSMIPNITLAYIHLRLCSIMKNDELPFGGCNVVILGDLLQLPPVRGDQIFERVSAETARKKIGSFGSYNLWEEFSYDELLINMRQNRDKPYGDLCTRLRLGKLKEEDIDLLNSRKIRVSKENYLDGVAELFKKISQNDPDLICMMPLVKQCDELNDKLLHSTCSDIKDLIAIDSIETSGKNKKQKDIAAKKLSKLKHESDKTAGLRTNLKLAVNAKVMIIRNIDVKQGLANGKIGTIESFIYDDDMETIKKVLVRFTDGKVAEVERVTAKFEVGRQMYVFRKQFPLTLAYAITIHKSQGKTFESALIDCSKNVFADGQAYIALSRLTSSRGLYLVEFAKESVIVNRKALLEYNRLRKKFRPDLQIFEVPLVKCTKKRKFTVDFKVHNADIVSEEPQKKVPKFSFVGMTNPDGVSCYCNASLQLLFSACPIIAEIKRANVTSIFIQDIQGVASLYETKLDNNLDSFIVRNSLAHELPNYSYFTEPRQQDASEFLLVLLDAMIRNNIDIHSQLGFTERIEHQCSTCLGKYNVGEVKKTLLYDVVVPDNVQKVKFRDLFMNSTTEGFTCNICHTLCSQEVTVHMSEPKSYLLLLMRRFKADGNGKIGTPVTNFNFKDIRINNYKYKAISAVAHIGRSSNSGHYVAFVKKNNGWLKISDTNAVMQDRFPYNMRDITMLLLQKL